MHVLLGILLAFAVHEVRCQNGGPEARIVNGESATAKQYPFFVLLTYRNATSGEQERVCGGSIISPNRVLTAARCFQKPISKQDGDYYVHAGDRKVKDGTFEGDQVIRVKKFVLNKGYNYAKSYFKNDIAILHLEKRLKYSKKTKPVKMGDAAFDKFVLKSEECYIMGYGSWGYEFSSTPLGNPLYPNDLQAVKINLAPTRVCDFFMSYMTKSIADAIKLSDEMICSATKRGKGACTGDYGGPVVCKDKSGMFRQVGVASYHMMDHCALGIKANTRVSMYKRWIQNNM